MTDRGQERVLTDEQVQRICEAWGWVGDPSDQVIGALHAAARLGAEQATAAERERCARVCEGGIDGTSAGFASGCRSCALLIRNPAAMIAAIGGGK